MLQIRTILHPTDFSTQAGVALRHAVFWARRFDAALHLLHVLPGLGTCRTETLETAETAGLVSPALHRDIAYLMTNALRAARADDLPVRCNVAQSPLPARAVLTHARDVDADLIVMGCRGCTSTAPHLGSAAAEVMRRSSCPVLLVDERRDPQRSVGPLHRLAVYIDFNQETGELVNVVAALITLFRLDVDLVYVIPTQPGAPASLPHDDASGADLLQTFTDQFNQLCPRADYLRHVAAEHAAALRLHVRTGYPPDALAAFVREHASDLLLMLTPGLSTAEYTPLAASAERIVHQAACPVLLFDPTGKTLLGEEREAGKEGGGRRAERGGWREQRRGEVPA